MNARWHEAGTIGLHTRLANIFLITLGICLFDSDS